MLYVDGHATFDTALEWVVIEELETGLHPLAISDLFLLVIDLFWRGYKVCLSPGADDAIESSWGGLGSGRVADVVAEVVRESEGFRP